MTATPQQIALYSSRVVHRCLLECNGDVGAALSAAEYILATTDPDVAKPDEHTEPDLDLFRECQEVIPEEMPTKLPAKLGTIDGGKEVWLVDGNKVRVEHEMDFLFAANDLEVKDKGIPYIPEDTFWLDDTIIARDLPFDLYHEAHERRLMEIGWTYDRAHEHANAAEKQLRQEHVVALSMTKPTPPQPISAYFAYDIHNRRAQGILNRSLKAAKRLSADAKKDLEKALKRGPTDQGEAILKFIDKYRLQLSKLLTTTQLASVLEGAREVAKDVPTLATFPGAIPPPPSLEPKEAVALVDRLDKLASDARAKVIYDLPAPQQTYVVQAIAAKAAAPPIVPPTYHIPTAPEPENVHFPTIDEAVKQLAEKNVVTRYNYDRLDAATRAKSFTVANVDAQETLTKIRDALSENVREGADYETFRSKVMDAVDEGTFMSDAHLETVFRTNVQSAFSDGQMTVLQNPLVRSGFPYSAYDSIHDDRVREDHEKLDTLGIGGTNIYRNDDPVFQTFRPPWDYNCRCSWTPITVRHAAELGIEEAQKWLDTGVEPTEKAFVKMPDFSPPPGFQRAVSSAPLSVQLSMQSMDLFDIPTDHTLSKSMYGKRKPRTVRNPELDSVVRDMYPRNASNQFISKHDIAEAARDQTKHDELRESLPEEHRPKLDRHVANLQSGGTVHHPDEHPGLAVDINSNIMDWDWANYDRQLTEYNKWSDRDISRQDWRADVNKFIKSIRQRDPVLKAYRALASISDTDKVGDIRVALDEALDHHHTHLDRLDEQFELIGATEHDTRTVARLRHSVESEVGNLAEKYIQLSKGDDKSVALTTLTTLLDTFQATASKLCDTYEELAELAYRRIDTVEDQDEEPEEPVEPDSNEQPHGPSLAIGDPIKKRRYGHKPGPGWTPAGRSRRGQQIWLWGPNRKQGKQDQQGQQPAPKQPTPQGRQPAQSKQPSQSKQPQQQSQPPQAVQSKQGQQQQPQVQPEEGGDVEDAIRQLEEMSGPRQKPPPQNDQDRAHDIVIAGVLDSIEKGRDFDNSLNVTRDKRSEIIKTLRDAMDTMPRKTAALIADRLKNTRLMMHESYEGVTKLYSNATGRPIEQTSGMILGFYHPHTYDSDKKPELHVDMGLDGSHDSGTYTMTHELGHILDHNKKYSNSIEWQDVWFDEIDMAAEGEAGRLSVEPTGRLTAYARKNTAEGFAEYFRKLIFDPEEAKTVYPQAYQFFQRNRLI